MVLTCTVGRQRVNLKFLASFFLLLISCSSLNFSFSGVSVSIVDFIFFLARLFFLSPAFGKGLISLGVIISVILVDALKLCGVLTVNCGSVLDVKLVSMFSI